jgi:haloacetate dehalogenase
MLLEGFTRTEITTSGARIVLARGGKGPPLLLLHGNPFTHVHWHEIAPRLARDFTVVCPDLRGYGNSSKPPGTPPGSPPHSAYSFRAMALDQVEVMAALGFDRFRVAGHDRGARVVHRLCLDHPEKVSQAAVLDIIPQHHLYNHPTTAWATASYHWFFMIQPFDMPERLMSADPEYFIRRKLSKTAQGTSFFNDAAMAEYIRCFKNPETVHAMCEDYRATATVDFAMDTADFAAGRKVTTPLLLLWGDTGSVGRHFAPLEIWRNYASDIRGAEALPCGHYLAAESPNETYEALHAFFTDPRERHGQTP